MYHQYDKFLVVLAIFILKIFIIYVIIKCIKISKRDGYQRFEDYDNSKIDWFINI